MHDMSKRGKEINRQDKKDAETKKKQNRKKNEKQNEKKANERKAEGKDTNSELNAVQTRLAGSNVHVFAPTSRRVVVPPTPVSSV